MLVLERILAIPDQSIDYLQCGIAGKERAALAARGFVRKDGIKAKDYMIRTIQKTAKNKEKAIIKGDKKLPAKLSKPAKSLSQKSDQAYRLHEQTKTKIEGIKSKLSDLQDEGFKLQDRLDEAKSKVESGRTKKASSTQKDIGKFAASLQSELANGGQPVPVMRQKGNKKQIAELDDKINENFNQRIALQSQVKRLQSRAGKLLDASQDYSNKASQSSTPIAPDTAKKLAVTDKKGFQSEGSAAKKIKGAIAGVKGGKVVKGVSPRDRGIGKGFYVRDTLVSPDKFNALPKKQQQEILALKKEFESSGYIDARTAIGPDQSRRMSDRQRNKIADTASRVFAIEDKVKQALKPPSQKSAEAKQKEVKDLQAQIDFVNNEIRVQETFNAAKINSKRNNLTKQGYQDMLKRRAELQSKLQKMGK